MKVAYVCADPEVAVFGTGAAAGHVQDSVREWVRRGARVRIYCTRAGGHAPLDLTSVEVVEVAVDADDTSGGSSPMLRLAAAETRAQLAAARLTERVVDDGADVVHERYSLFSGVLADVTRRLSIPGALDVRSALIEEKRRALRLVHELPAGIVLRDQVRAAMLVTCPSTAVAVWVRSKALVSAAGPRVVVAGGRVDHGRLVTELRWSQSRSGAMTARPLV